MSSKTPRQRVPIKINRKVPKPALAPFTDHFQGFERVEAVRKVFGDRTEEVLKGLKIGFVPNRQMYMGIRDNDGNLAVGTHHLKNSPTQMLYLDVVHELVHINQRMTRRKWFHDEFMKFIEDRGLYYASPIEIQAYEHTVREAERIGMSRDEITSYLRIGDPPANTWRKFLKEMKLSAKQPNKRVTRFPVKIKRETTPKLYAFTEFFQGFERLPAVRDLFGDSTEAVLAGIKVQFVDIPWGTIYPNEDDGHFVITHGYFVKSPTTSVYLDAFLALNLVKSFSSGNGAKDPDDLWESPATLGAYSAMVKEARRLAQSDEQILTHLQLLSFLMPKPAYARFLKALGLPQKQDTTVG
ncbi:MAG: hypothetical protein OK456_08165 [Thaumarchaeota archaeon]|nr:hypothetical protein [Nitrososphaerota archaeon]